MRGRCLMHAEPPPGGRYWLWPCSDRWEADSMAIALLDSHALSAVCLPAKVPPKRTMTTTPRQSGACGSFSPASTGGGAQFDLSAPIPIAGTPSSLASTRKGSLNGLGKFTDFAATRVIPFPVWLARCGHGSCGKSVCSGGRCMNVFRRSQTWLFQFLPQVFYALPV